LALTLCVAVASAAAETETVSITGSRIRQTATHSPTVLQVLTQADLAREGISSPEQLVLYLNANGSGLDNLASNADVVGGAQRGNNGASSANLRGQGAGSTLVLVNGRRLAAHGLNGSIVDINQVPLAAVERIEILKDGASAIYGADAIGGVINFILRRNVQTVTASGFIDKTELGGGDIYRSALVGGVGDLASDGFNVMATLSYSNHRELRGDQRAFINTLQPNRGLSVDTRGTPFANIVPLGVGPNTPSGTLINSAATAPLLPGSSTVRASGGINPLALAGGAGCGAIVGMAAYDTRLWNFPEAASACTWDTGQAAVLQQPIQTTHLNMNGILLHGQHELSAEFTGSHATSAKGFSNLQLTPNLTSQNFAFPRNALTAAVYDRVFDALLGTFPDLAAGRGLPLAYRWRCIECGRREIQTTTDTGTAFMGAEGPMPLVADWTYRTAASYAFSRAESQLGSGYAYRDTTRDASGKLLSTGLIDALNSGLINPFLLPGERPSQAALDALAATSARGVALYDGRLSTVQADFALSGHLLMLPAGAVQGAFGLDYRQEHYAFTGDRRPITARPVILAAPFDDGNVLPGVERKVWAAYAELQVPVTNQLAATLAGRRDQYSGFGGTFNPKLALTYRPAGALMFRADYNTGFRVPAFNQRYNGSSESPYAGRDLADPRSCPGGVANANSAGCTVVQPVLINGGKPDLAPETARQGSLGLVLVPTDSSSISLDWWRIARRGTIELLTLQQLAGQYGYFQDRYLRNAAGTLTAIDLRWINAGESRSEGLELSARYGGVLGSGHWSAGIDGSRLLSKSSRIAPGLPFGRNEVGLFSFAGDLGLKWKHNASLSFAQGDWLASVSQSWRSGYRNYALPGVAAGLVSPPGKVTTVGNTVTYNASLRYQGFNALTVTAGIRNLFNQDPPFAIAYDSNYGSGSSYEPRVADPRNRSFTLAVEYHIPKP
jgi:iron complex outermembrane receptor protein